MDNSWVTQIEEKVESYLKAELPEDVSVTSEDYTGDTAVFPAVYVKELTQQEIGSELMGDTIAAVRSTFQIEVYTNASTENKELSTKVMLLMKELSFEVIAAPLKTQQIGYYRSVSRYRRVVAGGDVQLISEDDWD